MAAPGALSAFHLSKRPSRKGVLEFAVVPPRDWCGPMDRVDLASPDLISPHTGSFDNGFPVQTSRQTPLAYIAEGPPLSTRLRTFLGSPARGLLSDVPLLSRKITCQALSASRGPLGPPFL